MAGNRTGQEPSLLVIDDDDDVVSLVSRALENDGWRVTTCQDAAQAHAQVKEEQPTVVLLDIALDTPGRGWSLLQHLRDDPATRNVPVIVFSSQLAQLEEREAWLLDQRISVLSKPFELDDLYDAVREFQPRQASVRTAQDQTTTNS